MNVYERNINASIETPAGENLITRASLLDLDHNIRIQLITEIATRTITSASVEMVKTPFEACRQALPNVEKLKGLKIERGFAKKMRKIVGGNTGCTHIVELMLTAASLTSNAILLEAARDPIKRRLFAMKSESERMNELEDFLKDSCVVFKQEE